LNKTARRIVVVVVLALALLAWSRDFVSIQGEKTVYTVNCEDGAWSDDLCTSKLVAAERYRFRALPAHHEVVFGVVGSSEPSGKLTGCEVTNGRNWTCKPGGDSAKSITLSIVKGCPRNDLSGATRPFHSVSKWKWWLINANVGRFQRADFLI
jgi:hypothetical protein